MHGIYVTRRELGTIKSSSKWYINVERLYEIVKTPSKSPNRSERRLKQSWRKKNLFKERGANPRIRKQVERG